MVNRRRCTDLSRTVCGRKRKVTLSRWEGGVAVDNTCSVTEANKEAMTMTPSEPDRSCV